MNLDIGNTLSVNELNECEKISTINNYDVYMYDSLGTYIFAVNGNLLVCSCFEFHEGEDNTQLAHMNTLNQHQGQGLGKHILAEAVEMWSYFDLPSTDNSKEYYFVEDGYGWINHCFDIGILSEPPFTRP